MAIETEIKIKIDDRESIAAKLASLGAAYNGEVLQKDSYFDSEDNQLKGLDSCLRLRCESGENGRPIRTVLCYKGPKINARVKTRTEIETEVDNADNIEQILTALGYDKILSFSKRRQTWLLNGCQVCLDELALIGDYIEIEGKDEDVVLKTADMLGLDTAAQEVRSYASLIAAKLEKYPGRTDAYMNDEPAAQGSAGACLAAEKNGQGLVYMIINPNSGSGFATSITGRLDDYFRSKGMGMRICRVNEFGDIKRNVEVAAKSSECRLVVVTGGDGTVREAAQHLIGSGKPLMIIPGGTENLLAHELGCDRNIDTYIRMYEQDSITALDLIRVNGCYFTSILGIGFDAEVVHILSRVRSGNITHADYIWPIWRAFWSHDIPSFCVEADGEQVFSGRGMFFAGNISRYATGLRILQNANLCDGMLDVCVYPCRNKPDILKFLSMTMLGIHTKSEDVVYRKCRKVRVRALDKNVVTQIDGDPGPLLPLDIEVVPGAVNVYNCIYKSRQGGTA